MAQATGELERDTDRGHRPHQSQQRCAECMAERANTRQLDLDDCQAISRRVSELLDEQDPIEGAYRLEVSSPGIDRPLTRRSDFADWAGHEARIRFDEPIDGAKQVSGIIDGISGGIHGQGYFRSHLRNLPRT